MKRFIIALSLIVCAVDVQQHIYACFGYDWSACQSFVQQFRGQYGQQLTCWIK